MTAINFSERDQRAVLERILRHCGLWEGTIRTLANPRGPQAGVQGNVTNRIRSTLAARPESFFAASGMFFNLAAGNA